MKNNQFQSLSKEFDFYDFLKLSKFSILSKFIQQKNKFFFCYMSFASTETNFRYDNIKTEINKVIINV